MVTKIINCRHCGSENIIKFGKTPNHKQRYRCHDCGKQSRENPTVKYTEEQKEMILRVYQERVVYKKRMLFGIFSCTNSVRQFILSAWLLKLLIVGTVEVKISLNLARRPTINSATAAMIVVNKAAKTPQ